jgi:hypothetical protein
MSSARPVRVLGPRGPAGRAAAVVGAGVVGRHGARVVAALRLDGAHLRDREARREQGAEHPHDRGGGVAVDDQLARAVVPLKRRWVTVIKRRSATATGQPGR